MQASPGDWGTRTTPFWLKSLKLNLKIRYTEKNWPLKSVIFEKTPPPPSISVATPMRTIAYKYFFMMLKENLDFLGISH
jgi:hypothetical protein